MRGESTMENAGINFEIVQTLNRILERKGAGKGLDPAQVARIKAQLQHITPVGQSSTEEYQNLLKNIFSKDPELLTAASVETVREIIGFALACCAHYERIKASGHLNDEEKQVGKELTKCLTSAQ